MANAWTSQRTGNWSRTSDNADSPWHDGGTQTARASIPVDTDGAITIAAAHVVTFDVDQSSWTTGLAGVVVQGGATPGMLEFATGASAYMRIKAGSTISGTLSTNRGRFKMGGGTWAVPSALSLSYLHTVEFLGASAGYINAANLDIIATCTEPGIKWARIYGTLYTPWTGSAANDTLTLNTHGLANNTAVCVRSSGTLPAPLLTDTIYYVRNTATNTIQLAYYSGGPVIDLTSDGSGTIDLWTGFSSTSTKNITVLDDVTSDLCWTNTVGNNAISIVNMAPTTYAQQRDTLATIAAGTLSITAANNAAARSPAAIMVLLSRNVRIWTNDTAGASLLSGAGGFLNVVAEIRNLAGSGTSYYGNGLASFTAATGNTLGGIVSGFNSGTNAITGITSSCIFISNAIGSNSDVNHNITGYIFGCSTGITSATRGTMSGTVAGCTTGINSCTGMTVSGTVKHGTTLTTAGASCIYSGIYESSSTAFNTDTSGIISGAIKGASTAVFATCRNTTFSGTATGYATGISAASAVNVRGGIFYSNGATAINTTGRVSGWGMQLSATTPVSTYLYSSNYDTIGATGVWSFDPKDSNGTIQTGAIAYWCAGGKCESIAYSSGTHGTPPTTLTWVHTVTHENGNAPCFIDIPIWCAGGATTTVAVYLKSAQTTWVSNPTAQLIDPGVAWGGTGEVLANPAVAFTDDTNWQTLTLTLTPNATAYPNGRQVYLRVRSTRASGTLYWNWAKVETGGGYTYGDADAGKVLTTATGAGTFVAPTASQLIYGQSCGVSGSIAGTQYVPAADDVRSGTNTGTTTGTIVIPAAQYLILGAHAGWYHSGDDTYEVTGTYDANVPYLAGMAAQLATDQAAVLAAAESIDGGVTILGQEGTGVNLQDVSDLLDEKLPSIYWYRVALTIHNAAATPADEWLVIPMVGMAEVGTGAVTTPTLTVVDSAGTTLLSAVTLTEIGTTGRYKYVATGAGRTTPGASYVATPSGTIAAATRTGPGVQIARDY